jgi:hypothetical protein
MARRTASAQRTTPEEAACIDFNAALDAYAEGGDAKRLLSAACMVVGNLTEIDPKRAFAVAGLTGVCCDLLVDYDDAGRAVRRWFALMAEPGSRH